MLTQALALEAQQLLAEREVWLRYKFLRYFPDCAATCQPESMRPEDHGGLCRVLYRKHVAFMDAGREHRERLFLAANRSGKSETAAYELTAHLTGLYPKWWTGYVFDRPIASWAYGDTMLTTRDIVQVALLGPTSGVAVREWAGMIPSHLIYDTTRKTGGISDCIDQIWVRHVSGGRSVCELKSSDQGRRAFQGTSVDVIWEDEEAPQEVYTECLLRTMTTDGRVMVTMTPMQGLTPFIQAFLETAVMPDQAGALRPATEVFWPDGKGA